MGTNRAACAVDLGIAGIRVAYAESYDGLARERRDRLFEDSRQLISKSFGQKTTDTSFNRDVRRFIRNGEIYLLTHGEELIGLKLVQVFRCCRRRVFYNAGTAIAPAWQRRGINTRLTQWLVRSRDAEVVVSRTQNPNIYRTLQLLCSRVWPQLGERTPAYIQQIGVCVAKRINATIETFDSERLVDRGTYGSTLYDTIPPPENMSPLIQELFSRYVDVQRGDSMLVIGEVFPVVTHRTK